MLDLLLRNARILTLDERRPRAQAVGVLHGKIVGLDEEIADLSARHEIDCDGAVVTPGFADAHNHMAWFGMTLSELDLSACENLRQLYDAVALSAATLPHDGWVVGYGYDAVHLGGHPHRAALDRAASGRPVWLRHRSGHLCTVSSAVLELAGVLSGFDGDLPGGVIVRDDTGSPTGELQEQAQRLVVDLAGPHRTTDLTAAIARAADVYASEGLTHVTEAGIGGGWIGHSPIEAAAYLDARCQGVLPVRVELMVASDVLHPVAGHASDQATIGLDLGLRTGFGDDMLRLGPMKIFMDGSMTGRTAALSELLCGHSSDHGYLQADVNELTTRIIEAHKAGWRVAAHAIGDQALDVALDAVEAAQRVLPRVDVRHRIEHAAVTREDQVQRMAELGVVPVHQGRFVYEVGEAAADWVGAENVGSLLRCKSFIDAGLRVPGSSDRPVVVDGSPLQGMQAMVQRIGQSGRAISPAEAVTAEQALCAYTVDAAWVSHAEKRRGLIGPGLDADLVVLDDDPTTVRAEEIGDINVVATFVAGSCIHGEDRLLGRKAVARV